MNDKDFEKTNVKIVISIQQCTPVGNFSEIEELCQICPKKYEWKEF